MKNFNEFNNLLAEKRVKNCFVSISQIVRKIRHLEELSEKFAELLSQDDMWYQKERISNEINRLGYAVNDRLDNIDGWDEKTF